MPFICQAGEMRPDTPPGALHHLTATPKTVHWGYFDAALAPVLRVKSGDLVQAEAITHHAGDAAVAWSGGSEPGDQVNPSAVAAMKERGIDISTEYPKPWTDEIVRAADVVITMGCGDACPVFPGKRYEEWTLDDPAGLDVAAVRPIRDEIERRVLTLLDRLGVPA